MKIISQFWALPWHSIKTRTTLLTLTIFVVSIAAISLLSGKILRKDVQRQLGDQQFSIVVLLAKDVNQELENQLGILGKVAARIGPDMLGDPGAVQHYLEERLILQGPFNAGVVALGPDGTAIADLPRTTGRTGVNYMDRDFAIAVFREGTATIGLPVVGKKLQSPIFVAAAPIRDRQGKVIGALAGVTDLGQPNFLDRLMESRYGKTGGHLIVAPQQRLIISATDKSRIMARLPDAGINPAIDRFIDGYEGSAVYVGATAVELLASAKRIPVSGWLMVTFLPADEAFAPISNMQRRTLLAILLLTLPAAALIWWILRQQLAPIFTTIEALGAISDVSQPCPHLPIKRQDEIGDLLRAFNHLLETLAQREGELREQKEFFHLIAEMIADYIVVLDLDGRRLYNSPSYKQLLGTTNDLPGTDSFAEIHPDDRLRVKQVFRETVQTGLGRQIDYRFLLADGSIREMESRGDVIRDSEGQIKRVLVVSNDITESKRLQEASRVASLYARSLIEASLDPLVTINAAGKIMDVNSATEQVTGVTRDKLIGSDFADYFTDPEKARAGYLQTFSEGSVTEYPLAIRHVSGRITDVLYNARVYCDVGGKVLGVFAAARDITARKRMEDEVRQLAFHDPLTKLTNRRLLSDRLTQTMAASTRSSCYAALMFLDLDNFKPLNDRFGHDAGDLLLIEVAARLKTCIREMDTVARFGGDEFVVMISELVMDQTESRLQAALIAEKIRLAIARPYLIDVSQADQPAATVEHRCTASIGVTLFIDHLASESELFKWADKAMYEAKQAGRNSIRFFDPEATAAN